MRGVLARNSPVRVSSPPGACRGQQVEIDGLDPAHHRNEVRKKFGIVFQDPSLDDELTAWENMDLHGALYAVPRKLRAERSEQLLKLFELFERR